MQRQLWKLVDYLEDFGIEYNRSHLSREEKESTGYYFLHPDLLLGSLEHLIHKGRIKNSSKFLDLGCGLGLNVVAAASQGLNSTGIEINKCLIPGANELISDARQKRVIALKTVCQVVQGSYFPNRYIQLRQEGKSHAPKFEGKYEFYEERPGQQVFFPVANHKDIYDAIAIPFEDFDVLFSYCWAPQVSSLLEIFSQYAKDDAILLMETAGKPKRFNQLLNILNLQYKKGNRWKNSPEVSPMDMIIKKS